MDFVCSREIKLLDLNADQIKQLKREGVLTSGQAEKLLAQIKTAGKIWQPIHDQVSQTRFP